MPRVSIFNLGCSKNMIDGERMLHQALKAGYTITNNPLDADLLIVNTCAFIREAQQEAVETILEAVNAKGSRGAKLVVAGCFSERFRNRVASHFPEVDLWVGVNDWDQLLEKRLNLYASTFKRVLPEPRATQYIKIAEGCSHRCSFCAIPAIRGSYRSRPVEAILEEAGWLEEEGVKELIIVSQDTSFYGKDLGTDLTELLEKILQKTLFPWIRLMYLHPAFVNDDLLRLVASEKRLCPYFDIPLQHISDPLLRSMKRMPPAKEIRSLIERIRCKVPDSAIRSAFILGYPGETEQHFRELVRFVEWARFEKLGVFPYSPEDGTAAVLLRPRPRNSTAMRRCETLMVVQKEISREINEKRIGSQMEVIIDRLSEEAEFKFEARSRFDAPEVDGNVLIRDGNFKPGTITRVTISAASDYDLFSDGNMIEKKGGDSGNINH